MLSEMGRKKRETMLKKKKENDLHEPITYQSGILIKIDGDIWWPGYVVEGCGTFLNEEEEFSIPLTCSNWCPIPSSVDDTKIKKSLGKLSAEYKKSYKQDLMKLQGRAPQQKKRKSNNGNEDSSPKKQKPSSPWKWSCSLEDQGVEKSSLRIDGKHTIKCPSQLSASMIESSDIQPSVHTSDIQPSVISQSSNMGMLSDMCLLSDIQPSDMIQSSDIHPLDIQSLDMAQFSDIQPSDLAQSSDIHLLDMAQSSDLQPSDIQPSVIAQALDIQPSDMAQSSDIQPSVSQTLDMAQSSDLQPSKMTQYSDIQPSVIAQSLDIQTSDMAQPSEMAQSSDIQPSVIAQSLDIQPSDMAQSSDIQPSVIAQSLDIQPSDMAQSSDIQPSVSQTLDMAQSSDLQPSKMTQYSDIQPSVIAQSLDIQTSDMAQPSEMAQSSDIQPSVIAQSLDIQPSDMAQSSDIQPSVIAQSLDIQPSDMAQSSVSQTSDMAQSSDILPPDMEPSLDIDQHSDIECFNDWEDLDNDADSDFVPPSDSEDDSEDDSLSVIFPITKSDNTTFERLTDPNKSKLKVQISNNKDGIRLWDKMHFCMYCHEGYTNITKHYFGPHKNETEVQRILSHPLKSEGRRLGLLKLRNSGDYHHNTDVLKSGSGLFVTWTRNEGSIFSPHDYLPCEDCLGFFLKSNLWRHRKVCPLRKSTTHIPQLRSEANLLLPAAVDVCEAMQKKVIGRMKADKITQVVRNDATIIRLGEKLFQKHGHLPHLFVYVSQKMRELGRFLISAREEDRAINSLADVLLPEKFTAVVRSTKKLCGYNCDDNKYANPSLALKIGHLLKKCAMIQKANALMTEDASLGSKSDAFLSLCEMEWTDSVSGMALQTLSTAKMNKGQLLPLTEDIKKVQDYLKEKTRNLTESLKSSFSKDTWNTLNQVTLTRLVLFNRRRGGEAERITVKEYKERQKSGSCLKDIEESLSPMEKALCSTFERVEIRGKRGRIVPVLLTSSLQKSIECLMKHRDAAGVHPNNKYVFPRSSFDSLNPIRSADSLRRFGREAKLCVPENLTSTQLRKHVATVSQVLNLTKNDLENIAGFMGHDIEIHRSFYRLPQETLQVARMGRLLTAFDSGDVARYSGKSIEEIPVDEDLELDDQLEGGDEPPMDIEDDQSELNNDDQENISPDATPNPNPVKRSNNTESPQRKGQVKLNVTQQQCLKQIFQANVNLRKELKRKECEEAIAAHSCLKGLEWKKIKNTIHNWITNEKNKTKKILKRQEK